MWVGHHGRVVSIPFTLSIFVWIIATEDLLLVNSILKLRLRQHVHERVLPSDKV